MEGAEALFPGDGCGGDPMDFSWTADGEKHPDPAACASPGRDDEATSASTPVPSQQEMAESMILVPGPRVVMSGLRLADCRSGAVSKTFLPRSSCSVPSLA